ncbi:Glycosyltransferase [Frankia sp. Hr75.2]|nr:Glycosyltransferase [Frankia sp. Hr75.2]
MARYLVYCTTAPGHLFPLVPGLRALRDRGHEIHLRIGARLVDGPWADGLNVAPTDPRIDEIEVKADASGTGPAQLRRALAGLMSRGPLERADLERAVAQVDPDVILVDTNAYGAAIAARASGRPWGIVLPSLVALPGKGIPPYGLGLVPGRGPLGRLRDRVVWPLVIRQFGAAMLPPLNAMRADAALPPPTSPIDYFLEADRLLVLTGDPLEYPRSDAPEHVRFVGAQIYDPPGEAPAWLAEDGDPWVLVTTSTDYQGDERLAVAAVICHSGMGIVHKAIAAGVPVVAVPFGRDQPEVARRVVEAGAGVMLPARRLTAQRLRDALRTAMSRRAGALNAARRIRASGGGESFATEAEGLAAAPRPAAARPAA